MRIIRILIGLSGVLLLALPRVSVAADPPKAQVDAVFADYDTTASPGCSLGVMRGGEMIYSRGYGMANLEYAVALSSKSVFRIGSTSKQFTAMAMALLAEKGIISLDDPIGKLFPEFPGYGDEITIRHLVHHTSGIRDYLTLTWLAGMDDDAHYTDGFAIELVARQKNLNFPPGDQHLYSNSGYFLLSHVVERATGKSLREWAAENIFGPLGMHNSHFHDDHTQIVPNRADGYAPTDGGFRTSMTTLEMVGDGGVYTTVEDLLLWDRNFYDNRLGKGGPELIEQVTTPGSLGNGDALDYAFGLDVGEYRGLKMVSHSGGFVGYRAEMIRFPDEHFSVAVLCNRADADPSRRAQAVASFYLADVMEPEEGLEKSVTGGVQRADIRLAELERVIGHYWGEKDRIAREVRLKEDKLFYLRSEKSQNELAPLGGNRFAMMEVPGHVKVRFEQTGSAGLRMIIENEDQEPTTYDRFEKVTPTVDELINVAGTYYAEELDVDYVLEVHDGSLRFGLERPGDHVLEAQFGEIFTNPDYGTFEFQRGPEGQVVGFSLDAGRVRKLAFALRQR